MPRNSFGVYSLPPVINPVVTDTVIETTWANPTLNDIGNELTGSLPRNGAAGMTGTLKIQDGNSSAPGIGFVGASNTGLYRNASQLGFTVAGQPILTLTPNTLHFGSPETFLMTATDVVFSQTGELRVPAGTTAQRPVSPAEGSIRYNTDTGMFEYYTPSGGGSWNTTQGEGDARYLQLAGGTMTGDILLGSDSSDPNAVMRKSYIDYQDALNHTILNGTGAPSNALGQDGDFYMQTGIVTPAVTDSGSVGQLSWRHAPNSDWLAVNGQTISKTTYATLWAWAQSYLTTDQVTNPGLFKDGGGDNFLLPVSAGLFIRATGGNAASLGVKQAEMIGPHTHPPGTSFVSFVGQSAGGQIPNSAGAGAGQFANTGSNTGTENRPQNIALVLCIRATVLTIIPAHNDGLALWGPKVSGAWPATGVSLNTGAPGSAGVQGSVWYNGTGAPSGGLGTNGDYYLDNATGDVYYKSSGTWSVAGSIKGATGATGPTGPTGATGATGAQGLPGVGGQRQTVHTGPVDSTTGLPAIFQPGRLASLCHFEGANNQTTITDVCDDINWTFSGTAKLSTAQAKFGSTSLALDGTANCYAYSTIWPVGTGQTQTQSYTIEFWVMFNALPASGNNLAIVHCAYPTGSGSTAFGLRFNLNNTGGTIKLQVYAAVSAGGTWDITNGGLGTSTSWSTGTWYHLAMTYENGQGFRFYKDGVQELLVGTSSFIRGTLIWRLGYDQNLGTGTYLNGYIDEVRVYHSAVYPSGTTFTPPSSAFTNTTGHRRIAISGLTTNPVSLSAAKGFDASGMSEQYELLNTDSTDILGAAVPAFRLSYIYRDLDTASWGQSACPPQYGYLFDKTRMCMLHFEGTNGSTSIVDDFGNVFSAVSGATISTSQFKFGSSSLNSGAGGRIECAAWGGGPPLTDSWTVEFFVRFPSLPTAGVTATMFTMVQGTGGTGIILALNNTTGTLKLQVSLSSLNASNDIASASPGSKTTWSANTWYHIALCYDNISRQDYASTSFQVDQRIAVWVDGVYDQQFLSTGGSNATNLVGFDKVTLGSLPNGNNPCNAFFDDLMILPFCRQPLPQGNAVQNAGTQYQNNVMPVATTAISDLHYHFFNLSDMKMYEITGAAASPGSNPAMTQRTRVFVGEYEHNAGGINARTYAYRGMFYRKFAPTAAATNVYFYHNLGVPPEHQVYDHKLLSYNDSSSSRLMGNRAFHPSGGEYSVTAQGAGITSGYGNVRVQATYRVVGAMNYANDAGGVTPDLTRYAIIISARRWW